MSNKQAMDDAIIIVEKGGERRMKSRGNCESNFFVVFIIMCCVGIENIID